MNNNPQIRIPLMNQNRTPIKDQAPKQRNSMDFDLEKLNSTTIKIRYIKNKD